MRRRLRIGSAVQVALYLLLASAVFAGGAWVLLYRPDLPPADLERQYAEGASRFIEAGGVRFLLDVFGIATAVLAAWLWYTASRRRLRRISRFEVLDSADLNRIVTTINRSSLLNSRAALATAVSAGCLALRFAADLLADF